MEPSTLIRGTSEGMLRLFFTTPPRTGFSPAIFLDRDGVINERIQGGYVTDWKEFRFMEGVARTLAQLSALGLPMIVVSNQAGVGKGLLSVDALVRMTQQFVAELGKQGARLDAVYYCPHAPEAHCSCRKPGDALLRQAAEDWRLDLRRSILVGDSLTDLQAARASHCRAVLVAQQNGREDRAGQLGEDCLMVQGAASIAAGVQHFLREGMHVEKT